MRLPYLPKEPHFDSPEDQQILEAVKARRAPRGLLPLDRGMLYSPNVVGGYGAFLGAIRSKTSLEPDIREIAIARVAVLNKAWFEWKSHKPLMLEAGLGEEAVKRIRNPTTMTKAEAKGLNEKQATVLWFTDESTVSVQVKDECFEKLRSFFNEKETVEIVSTVAAYNCVSRIIVSLDIGEGNGTDPE